METANVNGQPQEKMNADKMLAILATNVQTAEANLADAKAQLQANADIVLQTYAEAEVKGMKDKIESLENPKQA